MASVFHVVQTRHLHIRLWNLRISLDFKLSPYSDGFQDSDVNSGAGGVWYCGGSVARDSENYNIFLQTQKQSN
jgi:hypothetical protein